MSSEPNRCCHFIYNTDLLIVVDFLDIVLILRLVLQSVIVHGEYDRILLFRTYLVVLETGAIGVLAMRVSLFVVLEIEVIVALALDN